MAIARRGTISWPALIRVAESKKMMGVQSMGLVRSDPMCQASLRSAMGAEAGMEAEVSGEVAALEAGTLRKLQWG